jgi:hypothetical protein
MHVSVSKVAGHSVHRRSLCMVQYLLCRATQRTWIVIYSVLPSRSVSFSFPLALSVSPNFVLGRSHFQECIVHMSALTIRQRKDVVGHRSLDRQLSYRSPRTRPTKRPSSIQLEALRDNLVARLQDNIVRVICSPAENESTGSWLWIPSVLACRLTFPRQFRPVAEATCNSGTPWPLNGFGALSKVSQSSAPIIKAYVSASKRYRPIHASVERFASSTTCLQRHNSVTESRNVRRRFHSAASSLSV